MSFDIGSVSRVRISIIDNVLIQQKLPRICFQLETFATSSSPKVWESEGRVRGGEEWAGDLFKQVLLHFSPTTSFFISKGFGSIAESYKLSFDAKTGRNKPRGPSSKTSPALRTFLVWFVLKISLKSLASNENAYLGCKDVRESASFYS